MVVSLLALSRTPFSNLHQQQLAVRLFQARPELSLDVEYLAESCLRIVCRDLGTAQSLTSTVQSLLHGDRDDVQVMVETFDVVIQDLESCHALSPDDLAQSNRLSMEASDILDIQSTLDHFHIIRFLRLAPADSALVRGIFYNSHHYKCKAVDVHDRGAFWCYRCGQIFCLAGGGQCERKKPSCRYCGLESHMSRACPDKGSPDFTPTCNPCKVARGAIDTNHAAWDAFKCRNTWHRRPTHPDSQVTLKRKRMQQASPQALKHRPTPSGRPSCSTTTTARTAALPPHQFLYSTSPPPLTPHQLSTLPSSFSFESPSCPAPTTPIRQIDTSSPPPFPPTPFDFSPQQPSSTSCNMQPIQTISGGISARFTPSALVADWTELTAQVASASPRPTCSTPTACSLLQPCSTSSVPIQDTLDWEELIRPTTVSGDIASPIPALSDDYLDALLASMV